MRKSVYLRFLARTARTLFSTTGKTPLESIDDIEILRSLELGQAVRMAETKSKTTAVDEPRDITLVESIPRGRGVSVWDRERCSPGAD